MNEIRRTAVAGAFYPGEPSSLAAAVDGYLDEADDHGGPRGGQRAGAPPKALVVPHAGYVYSGPVAARAYAAIRSLAGRVERVVLLGPAHFVRFKGIAVPRAVAFDTPLGPLEVDTAAIGEIAGLPGIVPSDAPHEPEHALEVQLPFIRRVLGAVSIVPLAVGEAGPDMVASVLETLWGGPETLIVVSSDLSHYHGYAEARRRDAGTAIAIEAFDGARLGPEDACGHGPLAGLLATARRRGLAIERLDLRNSGNTAGSRHRVVGYGAWSLFEGPKSSDPTAEESS